MLTKNEMNRIEALLVKASDDDMNAIANMFNDARRMKSSQAARSFKVGQQVQWFGKRGPMAGKIEKINRKNIVVNAGQFGMWNVSASLLKAA